MLEKEQILFERKSSNQTLQIRRIYETCEDIKYWRGGNNTTIKWFYGIMKIYKTF